jgi:alcohol dehydrogenase
MPDFFVVIGVMARMKAALLEEHGEPLAVGDVERPEPDPDQVVVETEACGVCRSDWHAWQGDWEWIGAQAQPSQILGHEPAGVVAAAGEDVETLREGDRVGAMSEFDTVEIPVVTEF